MSMEFFVFLLLCFFDIYSVVLMLSQKKYIGDFSSMPFDISEFTIFIILAMQIFIFFFVF